MKVTMIEHPTDKDWYEAKRRAMITIGKTEFLPPTETWKRKILRARHSPIRYLRFSFLIECPYWVSVHLSRHIHAFPYIGTQRNDRQSKYDRNKAPQDAPVMMIWDLYGEELMNVANKRLCKLASEETREVIREMMKLVAKSNPEFREELVPMCEREGSCHEMTPCYYRRKKDK